MMSINKGSKFRLWLRNSGLSGIALASVVLVAGLGSAQAQDAYPGKAIRLVVPYPPGGVSDNSSRAIAERLGRELNQTIIIENKAGAASTLASNLVARAPADGYTLYAAPVSVVINPTLQGKVEYDPQRDFAPISMMITSAFVLQTNKELNVNNMAELLARVRANPDKFAIGTSGMGSINHLAAEYFMKAFDLKMAVIHYKGGSPAAQDLIGGRIQMMFSATNEAMPFIQAGRTQGIAVTSAQRVSTLPELPTVDEATGTQGFDAEFWLALLAPAKTPPTVLNTLQTAMQKVGADRVLAEDLAKKGVMLKVSSPAEVQGYMDRDGKKWGQIIKELGIQE